MFTIWFATQISEALGSDKTQEYIDITLNLSTLKLLKTKRIIEFYDEMTSESWKMQYLKDEESQE